MQTYFLSIFIMFFRLVKRGSTSYSQSQENVPSKKATFESLHSHAAMPLCMLKHDINTCYCAINYVCCFCANKTFLRLPVRLIYLLPKSRAMASPTINNCVYGLKAFGNVGKHCKPLNNIYGTVCLQMTLSGSAALLL